MPFNYYAYGLTVSSELPLDLPPDVAPEAPADVTVRYVPVPQPSDGQLPAGDGCWHADENEAVYFWPEVGAFRVHGGRHVELDPLDGVEEDALGLVVLGRLVAAILHQRGAFVLHASAVAGPAGAVGIAAHSGTGKSTSAGALARRGYRTITDDVLAVDLSGPIPLVRGGGRGLKLWPASVDALHGDESLAAPLTPVVAGSAKRVWSLDVGTEPTPLVGLYVLDASPGPAIEPLDPARAVLETLSRSYCSEELRLWGAQANLSQAADLARRVPVRHLRRPQGLAGFDRWAAAFGADAEGLLGPL